MSCFTEPRYDLWDDAMRRRSSIGRPLMHSAHGRSVRPEAWRGNMKTFIAALSLLTLIAIASSFISLPEHRHAGQAGQSIFPGHPSGGWDQAAK